MLRLEQVSAPSVEPVSLADAKLHLRVDIDDDDDLITGLIVAAREHAEEVTRRALITQTWNYYRDDFPAGETLLIPRPPLQSVGGIYYTPDEGSEQEISNDEYQVDAHGEPGRVVLTSGASWPGDALVRANGLRVQFVAGYGDEADDVPEPIRLAIKMMVGHWYENREWSVATGNIQEVPFAVDALLRSSRVLKFSAYEDDV